MTRDIPFVAKRPGGGSPWTIFGATRAQYERWAPHICGIACCRSLILAKHRVSPSLWKLTELAVDLRVFIEDGGTIRGAYHEPLVDLLDRFEIPALRFGNLRCVELIAAVADGPVLLSVNLAAIDARHTGSHLILVFDIQDDVYLVHDNAGVICSPGSNCRIPLNRMDAISNGKGIAAVRWGSS